MRKYGVSSSKLAHIIQAHPNNGFCGFWLAVCGREFHPTEISDNLPKGAKLCARCKVKMDKDPTP